MEQPEKLFADVNCIKLMTAKDAETVDEALLAIIATQGRDFAVDAMYFHIKAQLSASGNLPIERTDVEHVVDRLIFEKLLNGEAKIL